MGVSGRANITGYLEVGGGLNVSNGMNVISGNGGIGTTAPTQKLSVASGNIILDNDQYILWGDGQNGINGNAASDYLTFATNNLERMRITNGGNVGIGTTSPVSILSLSGGRIALNGSAGAGPSIGTWVELRPDGQLYRYNRDGSDYTAFYIDGDPLVLNSNGQAGNVGIGVTQPGTAKLVVNNTDTASNYHGIHINNEDDNTAYGLIITGASTYGINLNGGNSDNNCVDADGPAQCALNDYAEMMEFSELPDDGEVIIIDAKNPGKLKISTEPYSRLVAGVASEDPAMVIGSYDITIKGWNKNQTTRDGSPVYPLAIAGRKIIKTSEENGKIMPGDLLVSSSESGKAMRCDSYEKCQGAIIGKAMGKGKDGNVLALITLQ